MLRLPSSARSRKEIQYLKLLRRIDSSAPSGFGFEGAFLRPGALVDESDLRPAPDYPPSPVLLECAGATGRGVDGKKPWAKRNRSAYLYILWRLSPESKWIEAFRALSDSWDWTVVLMPAADRMLRDSWGVGDEDPDLPAIAHRIGHYLDGELEGLKSKDRVKVLTAIHDLLAAGVVRNTYDSHPFISGSLGPPDLARA